MPRHWEISPGHNVDLGRNLKAIDIVENPEAFNRLLEWKRGSPRELRKRKFSGITRGAYMQRQFTIELRVDYEDPDKHQEMRKAAAHAARHMHAIASLLADNGVKPQVSAFSDDWFSGQEEINLLEDIIAQGLTETDGSGEQTEAIDPELIRAMADINR